MTSTRPLSGRHHSQITHQQVDLDAWTDLHETLGEYSVLHGLLHEVLFDFRSEPLKTEVGCVSETGCRKVSHQEDRGFGQGLWMRFKNYS